jgi:hypothetical protein
MRPAQKGPDAIGEPLMPSLNVQYEASGKTEPGPIRFGAVLRATMTEMEPMTGGKPSERSARGNTRESHRWEGDVLWARASVAQTWSRDSVWRRIMPSPMPWIASRTPSQSQRPVPR